METFLFLLFKLHISNLNSKKFTKVLLFYGQPIARRWNDESLKSELPPHADLETSVYNFGVLLLEIISRKLPYFEEHNHLANWATEHLNDEKSTSYLINPTMESFKDEELNVIYEVIKDCIQSNPRLRLTMKDITPKLREVLHVSLEKVVPRLSPLWWDELEILSVEAT
ncbi:hypothetical protein VNO78_09642 [Psophocarpus tetragonolobus]|uniref:Protein kinase domain-containing protein n=1 Tax=Psophocarpus tetragonolobus TaxID=3891 RepID=A0AAN9SYN7_PSOTE